MQKVEKKVGLEKPKLTEEEIAASRQKMLLGVGASFITELQLNKSLQVVVKNSKGLSDRLKMMGLDVDSLTK